MEKEMTAVKETYTVINAVALYPRINQTYRFDTTEGRSVPCGPTEEGAVYDLSFKMDKEQAKNLYRVMVKAYAAEKKTGWPDALPQPFEEDAEGMFTGKAKLKGAYSGQLTTKPMQVDASNKILDDDFELTTNSIVNVNVSMTPYFAKGNVGHGVSLRLKAVQVIKHEPRIVASPFGVVEGFTQDSQVSPFEAQSDAAVVVEVVDELDVDSVFGDAEVAEPVKEPKLKVTKKQAVPAGGDVALESIIDKWDDES
tara:strand:+ start:2062 stop:2823 length:762 start_codon:yes stop_codon:yes gene_type:complete